MSSKSRRNVRCEERGGTCEGMTFASHSIAVFAKGIILLQASNESSSSTAATPTARALASAAPRPLRYKRAEGEVARLPRWLLLSRASNVPPDVVHPHAEVAGSVARSHERQPLLRHSAPRLSRGEGRRRLILALAIALLLFLLASSSSPSSSPSFSAFSSPRPPPHTFSCREKPA